MRYGVRHVCPCRSLTANRRRPRVRNEQSYTILTAAAKRPEDLQDGCTSTAGGSTDSIRKSGTTDTGRILLSAWRRGRICNMTSCTEFRFICSKNIQTNWRAYFYRRLVCVESDSHGEWSSNIAAVTGRTLVCSLMCVASSLVISLLLCLISLP